MLTLWLDKKTNADLRNIICLEAIKEEMLYLVNNLTGLTGDSRTQLVINNNFVNAINSIFIDNIISFVRDKNPLELVEGLKNGTLASSFAIGWRHCVELLGEELASYTESKGTEWEAISTINNYIVYLYEANKEALGPVIMDVFNDLYLNLSFLDFTHCRVTYPNGNRPLLILTGSNTDAAGLLTGN